MQDSYLTKGEVAQFLKLSTRSIDRLDANDADDRTFPRPVRLLGQKRWLKSAIEAPAAAQD
jgi:predicted DNA-binding transcriptional regulator AlpA